MRSIGMVLVKRHREVLALPTLRIGQIIKCHRRFRWEHGTEGVAHHGKLAGLARAEALLNSAWVRSVRNALRMNTNGTRFDSLASLVVALNVIEDLIAIKVRVVVRHRDGVWMEIQEARAEAADDEVVTFERLMNRRRHVQLANNRRKVIHVEAVRVVAAVPTNHVERVVGVGVRMHKIARFDAHFVLTLLIKGEWQFRHAQVALAVGRVF